MGAERRSARNPGLGRALRAGFPRAPPSSHAAGRRRSRGRSSPGSGLQSRSATAIGNVGGATAFSTPSALQALTTTPRSTSFAWQTLRDQVVEPDSSDACAWGPPGSPRSGRPRRASRPCAARRPARRRGTDPAQDRHLVPHRRRRMFCVDQVVRHGPRMVMPSLGSMDEALGAPRSWSPSGTQEMQARAPGRLGDLRRAPPPRPRHRRDGRRLRRARARHGRYGVSRAFMFCMDEPDRHPAFRARERPHARVRRALRGPPGPVRPPRPRRGADRGGDACLDRGAQGIKLHPALSGSSSTTNGSRRCSRSPPSGGCRS